MYIMSCKNNVNAKNAFKKLGLGAFCVLKMAKSLVDTTSYGIDISSGKQTSLHTVLC